MNKAIVAARRFFCSEEAGASMVEYGVMLALIAVICIGAITAIGSDTNTTFNSIAKSLKS